MEQVLNSPTTLTWSCDIPALEITTSADTLTLSVLVGSDTIQELTLYPYNGKVMLWELRDLVETHMVDNQQHVAVVSVTNGSSTLCSFTVIYLSGVILGDCSTFCENYFLTLSDAQQILPGIDYPLFYYGSETTATIRVAYIDDGKTRVASQSFNVNGRLLLSVEHLSSQFGVTGIVGVTVIVGKRTMNFFVNNEIAPDYVFQFINYFNVLEVVPINCATSTNQKGDRTIASVGRSSVLASLHHEVEHEVETAPLSPIQCSAVEQLCESPSAWLLPENTPIIITERTCDISDERGELQSVKFTWRTLSGRQLVIREPHVFTRIFTDEYDETYG